MERLQRLMVFVLLGAMLRLGGQGLPAPATVTASLLPRWMVTSTGGTSGSVSALAFRDQGNFQNTPSKYVAFTTPGIQYTGYQKFILPPHMDPANISTMKLQVNYRGPLPGTQVWKWHIYNWSIPAWVQIGTNAAAVYGKWTLFTFSLPTPLARFISPGREIRLRLSSGNTNGDAWLDYEALRVTYKAPYPSGTYWKPGLVTSWQIQYSGTIDKSFAVQVYNLDGFDTPKSVVDELHARGIKVMCYFSAGSWENWRPDAAQFPAYVKGKTLPGWADEKWLDIRRLDILGPIMTARIDLCASKGFDGIDPDNVDGYANDSGLPLTAQDQLNYNLFLAFSAHARGLAAGLKNDLGQIPVLVNYFDWGLNEECFTYNECSLLLPFINAGKPVFNIEYELAAKDFCPQANALNFNSLKKTLELTAFRQACR